MVTDFRLTIIRRADGEARTCRDLGSWVAWKHGPQYWWTEGNGSCDCNRLLEFARAGGEPDPPGTGLCLGEGGYAIRVTSKKTGAIIFEDL